MTLIGPNCAGVISPGKAMIGIMPGSIYTPGRVGIVARSGTLGYEAASQMKALGIGVTTSVGIGGDPINGSSFVDMLKRFEADPDTDAVMMIGEIGGPQEAEAALWARDNMSKPIVGYIAGLSAPQGPAHGPRGGDHLGVRRQRAGEGGDHAQLGAHRGRQPGRSRSRDEACTLEAGPPARTRLEMAKPKVVITRKLPAAAEERAKALFDVELNESNVPLDAAGLARAMREADGLLPCVADKITAEILGTPGRKAKIVANYGVGFNNIDVEAAKANGVVVTNTPDVLTEDTADLAMTLMLATARRAGEGERELRSGRWTGWRPTHMLAHAGEWKDARTHRHRPHRTRGRASRASRLRDEDHLSRSISAERCRRAGARRRAQGQHRGGAARERLRVAPLPCDAGDEASR